MIVPPWIADEWLHRAHVAGERAGYFDAHARRALIVGTVDANRNTERALEAARRYHAEAAACFLTWVLA